MASKKGEQKGSRGAENGGQVVGTKRRKGARRGTVVPQDLLENLARLQEDARRLADSLRLAGIALPDPPRPRIKVVVYEAEEGGYWAQVPILPGCATEGDTREELMANLREAIEGYLLCTPGNYEPQEGGVEEEIEL